MRVSARCFDRIVHAVGLHRGVVEVEAADVEHRLVGIARIVALQRTQVAVEVDVAIVEADRPSALELPDRLHAPAADERVGDSGGPAGPPPAVAERQLPDAAERDAVRRRRTPTAGSRSPLSVGFSLNTRSVNLRPGVGRQDGIAAREALLDLYLRRVVLARAVVVERVGTLPNCGYGRRSCERAIVAPLKPVPGSRSDERIRDQLREEIDRRLVAHRTRREVLHGDGVEVDLTRLHRRRPS